MSSVRYILDYIDYNKNVDEYVRYNNLDAHRLSYKNAKIGDVLRLEPQCLKVKTPEELECSRDGLGVTDMDTPIEVSKSGGHFVVFNGHHRLYNAIKNKVKDVLVKVVADEDVTPYGEFLMYYQERRYER